MTEPLLDEWGRQPSFWIARKITAFNLYKTLRQSEQVKGIYVDCNGSVYHRISLCGIITLLEDRFKHWVIHVDDSTGFIAKCMYFKNGSKEPSMLENTLKNAKSGVFVVVSGKIDEFKESRSVILDDLRILNHPNEESSWNLL